MTIIIKDWRAVNSQSALKGSFTVEIPKWHMQIRSITLFQKESQIWISFPSREYEKDGQKKYFSYIVFDKETYDAFQKMCVEELRKMGILAPKNPEDRLDAFGNDEVPF
jgi:hypothetical protein